MIFFFFFFYRYSTVLFLFYMIPNVFWEELHRLSEKILGP